MFACVMMQGESTQAIRGWNQMNLFAFPWGKSFVFCLDQIPNKSFLFQYVFILEKD